MNQAFEVYEPSVITARQKFASDLFRQAQGHFAPAKPGTFFAAERERLIAKFIRKGLAGYDAEQQQLAESPRLA